MVVVPGPRKNEICIPIERSDHVVLACQTARTLAGELQFSEPEHTVLGIAVMEIARNIIRYARKGEIHIAPVSPPCGAGWGIVVTARDQGPGIEDIEQAVQEGFSTGGGLGLGLPGAQRLVDEFTIHSRLGEGTVIIMKKWKR